MVAIPMLLVAVGLGVDACVGLPVTRGATSPQAWFAGVVGLGALYLLGEYASEGVGSRDKVTDPLWLRIARLAALLALWVVFVAGLQLVVALVR